MFRRFIGHLPLALLGAGLAAFPLAVVAQSPQATPATLAVTATPPSGTPTSTASPTPAGTAWPAPGSLAVETHVVLLGSDNRFLPMEERVHTDVLTWGFQAGFTGQYEIEVTTIPYGGGPPSIHPLIALPASSAGTGPASVGRVSPYPEWLTRQRCFRVRTLISSPAGMQTGPWTGSVCTLVPPSSGPGVPTGATPLPPDTGGGTGERIASRTWVLVAGAVVAALGAGGVAVSRRAVRGAQRVGY